MPRLLLGVSGGIAAYKALELVRLATADGYSVRVIQTNASQRFVGAASFAALSGAPVLSDQFERDPLRGAFPGEPLPEHDPASHLALSAAADVFLIAPASANTIAKLAHGLADNLLSAAALAARCPLIVAPAMNDAMWASPATAANVAALRERGVSVLEPAVGRLATHGEWGQGRMAEPAELLEAIDEAIGGRRWRGLRTLVTAGGTREPIDAVRFIGNRSSGRMGFAVAEAAGARGSEVVVLAANVALPRATGIRYSEVESASELAHACEEEFADADVLVMCAAVADYRPAKPVAGKLAREGGEPPALQLEPTADIVAALAARRREDQTLVGFAAEHGAGALERARAKRERKGLDAIVLNDISERGIGFDSEHNAVTIITAAGELSVGRAAKRDVADAVLNAVEALRA
ncbi:MAG TPA: bifunctional phosphopantothenoylcysteine decarboxylase/phosphopantothenate--cysteine ligase CoaBC [Solirubrobacteraceae bacterium]|jgi:phosphopantothenoylcysteine decarboxylase/phosphopantothenate--cysteine ligase|nr:bifunctional phosphopantothenoylcysteine decarboxylase/phosphopantothenate--cysteine ligase CoaBC [Solirubrobacteraceae bacterium]